MPIPIRQLPSLEAIRAFVAIARRMSITDAAGDLCRSQSAVSRQLQNLETALDCRLVVRGHRRIRLTAAGEQLFRAADAALDDMAHAVEAIGHRDSGQPVTISASIGVTGLWLLPRLGPFQQRHASIDVRVAANNAFVDLRRQGVDLAIRYCTPGQAPENARRLFPESIHPVAAPALALQRLDSGALNANVLLELDDPARPWLQWGDFLTAAGLGGIRPRGVLRFNQYDQIIHAALAGQGVALGRTPLIQPFLDDGRLQLVPLDGTHEHPSHGYYLLQVDAEPREAVRVVVDWVLTAAASTRASMGP